MRPEHLFCHYTSKGLVRLSLRLARLKGLAGTKPRVSSPCRCGPNEGYKLHFLVAAAAAGQAHSGKLEYLPSFEGTVEWKVKHQLGNKPSYTI